MHNEYVLFGAGGHAKVVIEIIEAMREKIRTVIDTDPAISSVLGYPVQTESTQDLPAIIAIGNNYIRQKIAMNLFGNFGTAIHPRANLSSRCSVSVGTVIMAGATINCDAKIGAHCIINTNASVDHDCMLGDFVHISPNASLAGNVTVGEGAHIGIGSSVIQGIRIGKWAIIGAGSVIITDVPDFAVVVGVPGKIVKYTK